MLILTECIQRIVVSRLEEIGLSTLRLPLNSQPNDKHVPILVSPNLRTASRIILILGSPDQELGIWTYRSIAEQSINRGSMVEIAQEILTTKPDTALVIANMGQLVYHCGSGRAMSQRTWFALPVETAAHPPPRQTWRNLIARNMNWREHAKCIFEDVLAPESNMVNPEAKIDIIGVEEGGLGAVEYLAENCKLYRTLTIANADSNAIARDIMENLNLRHLLLPAPAPKTQPRRQQRRIRRRHRPRNRLIRALHLNPFSRLCAI